MVDKSQSSEESHKTLEIIDYKQFEAVDLRVGKILSAEKVLKSRNLLKLQVDVGEPNPRQILSGIAAWYQPEDLINKLIIVCINLKPRKMMGLESNGMLLAADVNGTAVLLKPDSKLYDKIKPGAFIQ
ncbi:MAG: methionine--tRNA ligase subunit beta [Candidatus Lokiarchaeota archaeon]|nr:methionine--tRNA ligase subunit beta [Candidatus Harpocratesius repetitus]